MIGGEENASKNDKWDRIPEQMAQKFSRPYPTSSAPTQLVRTNPIKTAIQWSGAFFSWNKMAVRYGLDCLRGFKVVISS